MRGLQLKQTPVRSAASSRLSARRSARAVGNARGRKATAIPRLGALRDAGEQATSPSGEWHDEFTKLEDRINSEPMSLPQTDSPDLPWQAFSIPLPNLSPVIV